MVTLALKNKTRLTGGNIMVLTASELADYVVGKARSDNIQDLSPLKLQKILYYVQGWHLAFTDKPVFDENILAWRYGPVVKEIYVKFSTFGATNIAAGAYTPDPIPELDKEETQLIDAIWDKYKNRSPAELVTMTHQSKPWKEVFYHQNNDIIYTDLMRDYFKQYVPTT